MDNIPCDEDWIDFNYLKANRININFRRDKEWKFSLPLDELASLEEELYFDPHLTFQEKSVLLKQNEGPNKPEPFCKYCFKEFKKVGKSLFNHEAICYFNPEIVKTLNFSSFKGKVLKSKGSCPKCYLHFPSKLRIHANSCFAGISDFSKFLPRPESFSKSKKIIKSFDTTLLSQLPFFAFDGPLTEKEIIKIEAFQNHIELINDFKASNKEKFVVLFLNINSIFNKVRELDDILKQCYPDAFLLNESKLDSLVPNSWYINKKYKCYRLDRDDKGGGGELVFLKKEYIVKKIEYTDFETIYFQLFVDSQLINMLLSYKSPSTDNNAYLEKLENFLLLLDPREPLFIFGDLNMDLRSSKGIDLLNFLIRNDLKNFVNEHTRVCRSYYKEKKKFQTSKSLIDVCISNQNKVTDIKVIGCPFSDHKFLVAALDFSRAKHTPFVNVGRSLSEKNLLLIADLIKSQDFSFDKNDQNIDQIWNSHRKKLLDCIDIIAPLKTFKERPIEIAPWADEELLEKVRVRDYYYFKFQNSNTSLDSSEYYPKYKQYKAECQSLEREKQKEFMLSKKISDFKANKLYWDFHSAFIKINHVNLTISARMSSFMKKRSMKILLKLVMSLTHFLPAYLQLHFLASQNVIII